MKKDVYSDDTWQIHMYPPECAAPGNLIYFSSINNQKAF
jgi:hypothetical protein